MGLYSIGNYKTMPHRTEKNGTLCNSTEQCWTVLNIFDRASLCCHRLLGTFLDSIEKYCSTAQDYTVPIHVEELLNQSRVLTEQH